MSISPSFLDPAVAQKVADALIPVVVDLQALQIDGKQAHWNLRGPNFIGVHELLDTVVEHAIESADLAAERIVALGIPVDARVATIGAKNTLPELLAGFQQSDPTIEHLVAAIDATLKTVYGAIEALDDVDPVSQDTAIGIAATLDKDRWFLFAHTVK